MIVLDGKISIGQLSALAENLYGDMIKAVADVRNNLLAVDAELHSDLERLLLENGSEQELCRARDLFSSSYLESDIPSFVYLDKYFGQFAAAVRK